MKSTQMPFSRRDAMRHWSGSIAAGIVAAHGASSRLWADDPPVAAAIADAELRKRLTETSSLGEGPFYPDRLPLDTDNDLLVVNESISTAVGEITHLGGRVLAPTGNPIANATVEIWQCDSAGAYIHSQSSNAAKRDSNFQGYGRFLTDSKGRYYFRTIKPVAYPGRTPHIHFAISQNGRRILTTQMLVQGEPRNERDGVFGHLTNPVERRSVLAKFQPAAVENSPVAVWNATFNLVLNQTAIENERGELRSPKT